LRRRSRVRRHALRPLHHTPVINVSMEDDASLELIFTKPALWTLTPRRSMPRRSTPRRPPLLITARRWTPRRSPSSLATALSRWCCGGRRYGARHEELVVDVVRPAPWKPTTQRSPRCHPLRHGGSMELDGTEGPITPHVYFIMMRQRKTTKWSMPRRRPLSMLSRRRHGVEVDGTEVAITVLRSPCPLHRTRETSSKKKHAYHAVRSSVKTEHLLAAP